MALPVTDIRLSTRALPVLDMLDAGPPSTGAAPRVAARPADDRLAEYLPDARTLPRFHVWTLGCQMNRSDSEEMAGRLLAAGCEEAPSLETADLVVINTCAIREGAEQKVIGRQGQLARLKAANPGMRVVLTGCSVREPDRAGLRRRYPAVDLFLRPDEEPELVDRLGLASAQAPIGALGATTTVGRTVVGVADHLAETRARAVGQGTVARGSAIAAWLPIIYGCDKTCTYCIVPFSRGPERSRPFDDIVDEARALAAAGYREVTLLGQNVNSYGHDLAARGALRARRRRRAGPAASSTSPAARTSPSSSARSTRCAPPTARPAIGRLRFVTSHPWDLSDRLIAALADCASVCEHLHLPVQSGSDAVLRRMGRQYTIEHYHGAPGPDPRGGPRHRGLDRHHRRVLRRDRGAVRGDAGAARDRPLRPGLRRGLLAAPRDARHAPRGRRPGGRQAAPPQHAARRPGGDRAGAQRGVARARGRGPGRRRPRPARTRARRPPSRRGRAAASPAGRVATSSSTSPATRRSSGARSSSGSSTPARTRCEARSSGRDRRGLRPAARRRRRPDGDRQDRARDPARRGGPSRTAVPWRSSRPTRARSSAASTSGRPRWAPRTGRASRTTASTWSTRTSRSASPTSPPTPAASWPTWAATAASRSSPAGPACTCAPSARGLDTDALPSDPALRARLEADLVADGLLASVDAARGTGAGARRGRRHAQPAPGRPGPRDRRAPWRRPAAAAARLPRPDRLARAWPSTRTRTPRRIATRARAQFDAGLIEEARALRERFDPGLPAFSAIGYREAWAVLDGELTRDAAIELDAQRNLAFAKRQRTWFRSEPDITWLDATDALPEPEALAATRSLR